MAVKLGNGKWAVKENNLLAYNDNSGQFFNKEFDFTRGSSATYVGKDGLIKTAGLQDTNLVQNGDFSELGSEEVVNGDFATDSDWTKGAGWTISGGAAIQDGTGSGSSLQQSNIIVVGKTYKITYEIIERTQGSIQLFAGYPNSNTPTNSTIGVHTHYIKAEGNPNLYLLPSNFIGSIDNVSVKQVDPNDEWTLGSGWSYGDGVAYSDNTQTNYESLQQSSVTTIGKTYELKFNLNLDSGVIQAKGNAVYETYYPADNGEIVSYFVADSTFFRFTSFPNNTLGSVTNISVKEIQVNTPRIDFSDSADGALLLEPQSTNLIQYSEDFSDSYWRKGSNTTVINNYAISPEGKQNATRIQMPDTSGTFLDVNLSGLQGNTLTVSFYAKNNGGVTNITTYLLGNNLQTISLTDKWVKYDFTGIADTDVRVGIDNINGGGAVDFLLYGFQLEQLPYATSYIPTQGSASTRIAETCTNSGSAQDFNSEEGVLYAEISALDNGGFDRYISLDDSTSLNYVHLILHATDNRIVFRVNSGGVEQVNISDYNFEQTDNLKIACVYKQHYFSLWINGIERVTDISGNIPIGLNKLNLSLFNGTQPFYGKVKNIQVFTTALSDEELEKLTTI